MNHGFISFLLQKISASKAIPKEVIQNLWSGYGTIQRWEIHGAIISSLVVKHIQLNTSGNHPRGWNSDFGHQRKLRSYEVEVSWYKYFSGQCKARIPRCYGIYHEKDEVWIVLEDLDSSGYILRETNLSWETISNCLAWLAQFHSCFLGQKPKHLWPVGTYWHLATRPQELATLKDQKLKEAAASIDDKLNDCEFQTLIHGDAKVANFCFSQTGAIAAVDFQYVGGGCGMKDVAYFIGSCLDESACEEKEEKILDTYFSHLKSFIPDKAGVLEKAWRPLYRVAWADFHRFLMGWSPDHWKLNSYSQRVTDEVIRGL